MVDRLDSWWSGPCPKPVCCILGQVTFSHKLTTLSTQGYKWVPVNCQGELAEKPEGGKHPMY